MVVRKAIKMTQKMDIPVVGLIENMSYAICTHCNEKLEIFGKSQGAEVAKETNIEFLGGLPWDASLNELMDQGRTEEYSSEIMEEMVTKIISKLN